MSDDPAILSTMLLGLLFTAFAFLRLLAAERHDRLDLLRANQDPHPPSPKQPASN